MKLIQAAVHPDVAVLELRTLSVVSELAGQLGECRLIRNERPSVAESTEVLGRVEAQRRDQRRRPGKPPVMRSAQSLGTILDHRDPVPALEGRKAFDVEAAAIEVDRHEEPDLGVVFECAIREAQVQEAELVGIHEDGAPAGPHDRQGGRERAERRGQNLVAGPQTRHPKGQLDGV